MAASTSSRRPLRRITRWFGAYLALIFIIVVARAAIPVSTRGLGAEPEATGSYAEAVDRFQASTRRRGRQRVRTVRVDPARPRRADRPLDHALFHGLTNCLKQFREFGQHLHDQGYNVLVLRAPAPLRVCKASRPRPSPTSPTAHRTSRSQALEARPCVRRRVVRGARCDVPAGPRRSNSPPATDRRTVRS